MSRYWPVAVQDRPRCLARLGSLPAGEGPARFLAPHGLATDRHGDIYVGEVSFTNQRNMGEEMRADLPTLRKLVKETL